MISSYFVSVIAPLRNDADIVESFVRDVTAVLASHYTYYELILVDDGSEDETVAIVGGLLRELHSIRIIQLSRKFGQEIAISAGLDTAIGDYIVVMLPETDPPALLPSMLEQSRTGTGVVFGVKRSRQGEPLLRRLFVFLFFWYCNHLLHLNIPRDATHFRVLSRKAVNAVTQIKDRLRYLHSLSAFVGYSNQSFLYDPICRRPQPRAKSFSESVALAINIVVANSTQPLRLVSWLGFLASVINILYIGYVMAVYFFREEVAEGWATLSLQNATMFFFVFLILTVLSEYVGRILAETVERPLYYVQGERNSTVLAVGQENVVSESVEAPKEPVEHEA